MLPRISSALSLALLLLSLGCGPETERKAVPKQDPLSTLLSPPPDSSRVLLVSAADSLAVRADKAEGEAAAELFAEAAELREKSYRAYGKKVDAMEALELWSDAEQASSKGACRLGTRLVALRGELGQEPAKQYQDYYLLRERYTDGDCKNRIGRALTVLKNFEPSPDVLRELRESASHTSVTSGNVSTSGAHSDAVHEVVVPEVLRASLDHPTTITKIEPFGAEQTARVVVHVTHPTKFQMGLLEASGGYGPRLFVDIEHADFKVPAVIESSGLLKRVRLGKKDKGTRVVLDLEKPVHPRVFYLPEPFRLIIDVSYAPLSERANPRQIRRVVLDPGHGGHDPGAVGPNGLREKDVALDIAHRAAPLLAREVGVSTLLTRDVDAFVPLDERAARANAFHADLFISIHLNSSEDSSSKGVMTFVLDTSRDAAASKIAARENSSTEAAAAELANSLSRIESADRRAASETFAKLLQRAAGASLRQNYSGVEDQGVRRAGFYVLAGAAMPAVLFEGSFISNPIESQRLNSEAYRQRLADAVVNAVRAYREGL